LRAFVSLAAGDLFSFGPGAPTPEPEGALSRLSVEALEEALQGAGGEIRFVSSEARHLTLKFLGDVDQGMTRALSRALDEAVKTIGPFPVGVRGVGFFPNAQRAKVIWVGLDDPEHRIVALHDAIDAALGKLGVEQSSATFVPHVTIARVVKAPPGELLARAVDPLVATRFGWSRADGVDLVQSTLTPKGPVYKTLSKHAFADGSP
jgi:2'-5' RNA ligase